MLIRSQSVAKHMQNGSISNVNNDSWSKIMYLYTWHMFTCRGIYLYWMKYWIVVHALQMYAPTVLVTARDFWTLRYTCLLEDGNLVVKPHTRVLYIHVLVRCVMVDWYCTRIIFRCTGLWGFLSCGSGNARDAELSRFCSSWNVG